MYSGLNTQLIIIARNSKIKKADLLPRRAYVSKSVTVRVITNISVQWPLRITKLPGIVEDACMHVCMI